MAHAIIDRRLNGKGKSSVNRRKLIDRVRGALKHGVKKIVGSGGLKDLAGPGGKKIKIPIRNIDEPHFRHDNGTGVNDLVRPGNTDYVPGDRIKRPRQGADGQGNKASEDGEGEDSFTFHLTKEEFRDLFFENCALPDMVKQSLAITNQEVIQRNGFVSEGAPAMMNIMRSMRGAKSRRSGLRALKNKKLKELLIQEQQLFDDITNHQNNSLDCSALQALLQKIQADIETIKRRIKSIPYIDPIDLRYNNWTKVQLPAVQAAIICVMDVSGSMDERHKELAKTFYLLLYLFLEQNYDRIEITYIQYHTRAKIVEEQEFYYGQETGGTVASSGLQLAYDTIMKQYPTSLWNVYIALASDGDNWHSDNEIVKDLITNKLLPLLQYFAYIQINPEGDNTWRPSPKADPDNLWNVIPPLAAGRHLAAEMVTDESDVYPVFVKLFERKR